MIEGKNSQEERIVEYVVQVGYFGREDQAPDEAVARAIHLSLGTKAQVFRLERGTQMEHRFIPYTP